MSSPSEPMLRIRLLRTFERTAQLGSFSAASNEFGTTRR